MQGSATDASAVEETEPQIQAQLQMLGVVSDARWHFVWPGFSKACTQAVKISASALRALILAHKLRPNGLYFWF